MQLVRGPGFTLDHEKNHEPVAVLSYSYWTRRFFRNPSILGQTLYVKGVPFTVIGIAPQGFSGVEPGNSTDFWIPLQSRPELNAWGGAPQFGTVDGTPKWWCLELIARLKPGVGPDTAAAELNPAFAEAADVGIGQLDPKRPKPAIALKLARGIEGLDDDDGYRSGVIVLMILVSLVLLIACVNVTTLLLARKSARQREFSLRLAAGWQL